MLAAVSVPEPTLRDFVLLPAVLLVEGFMVTAFVTFNAIAGPRFSVPLRVPPVNVTERAVELTLTVTVWGGLAAARRRRGARRRSASRRWRAAWWAESRRPLPRRGRDRAPS